MVIRKSTVKWIKENRCVKYYGCKMDLEMNPTYTWRKWRFWTWIHMWWAPINAIWQVKRDTSIRVKIIKSFKARYVCKYIQFTDGNVGLKLGW